MPKIENGGVTGQGEQTGLESIASLYDVVGGEASTDAEKTATFAQEGSAYVAVKGKGKRRQGSSRCPVRHSNLPSKDRRRKPKELKSKIECNDCGRKGHCSGDRRGTMRKAHLATRRTASSSVCSCGKRKQGEDGACRGYGDSSCAEVEDGTQRPARMRCKCRCGCKRHPGRFKPCPHCG